MKGDFPKNVPYGYCYCGCGEKTKITTHTNTKRGYIRGEPKKFLPGHQFKRRFGKDNPMYGRTGKNNPMWNGGRRIWKGKHTSYFMIHMPEYYRSHSNGYVYEHILVVEKALGWPLPEDAVVHHIDSNGMNNKLSNLMVFKNNAEHAKFHAKQRRLKNG